MKRWTALVLITLWTIGTASSQQKYPKTEILDSSFQLSKYFGDTVVMYAPNQVIQIGKRMILANSLEQELGVYKILYSHCDSLRMIRDSSGAAFVSTIGHLESLNKNLTERLKIHDEINNQLSEVIRLERKKGRRQKFIYGGMGTGIGIVAGLITSILLR